MWRFNFKCLLRSLLSRNTSTINGEQVATPKDVKPATPLSEPVDRNDSQPKIDGQPIVDDESALGPPPPSSEIPEIVVDSKDSTTLTSPPEYTPPMEPSLPADEKQPELDAPNPLIEKSHPRFFASELQSELVGAGGAAKVYKLTRPSDNLTRAVKIIDLKNQSESSIIAFSREIHNLRVLQKDMKRLKKANGKRMKGKGQQFVAECPTDQFFGLTGNWENLYIIMRAYSQSLRLHRGTIRTDEAFSSVLLEVTQGLNYIHSLGIVHFDIKPENILLTEDNHCVIADFGGSICAPGHIRPGQSGILAEEVVSFTLGFCAPEIFNAYYSRQPDKDTLNCKADFFSLGMTMYDLAVPNALHWNGLKKRHVDKNGRLTPIDVYSGLGLSSRGRMKKRMAKYNCSSWMIETIYHMCDWNAKTRYDGKKALQRIQKYHREDISRDKTKSPLLQLKPEKAEIIYESEEEEGCLKLHSANDLLSKALLIHDPTLLLHAKKQITASDLQ